MGGKIAGSALSHDCPSAECELVQTRKISPKWYSVTMNQIV